jgi:hypothetical protein
MSQNIDKSIERKMFFHEEDTPPENCPRCNQRLVQDFGPYQIATRSSRRLTDEFVMSGDFGFLCPECATAVIHTKDLAEMLANTPAKPGWKVGSEFTVVGLVDFDAIPPDQINVPIDQLDPYPLVPFEAANAPSENRPVHKKRPRKPKPKRRK